MQAVHDPVESDTGCIRSFRGPIQAVNDLIRFRYRMRTVLLGPDTGCIGSYKDPIRTVYDAVGTVYRFYTVLHMSNTDGVRSIRVRYRLYTTL